jgi:hypothetical protein
MSTQPLTTQIPVFQNDLLCQHNVAAASTSQNQESSAGHTVRSTAAVVPDVLELTILVAQKVGRRGVQALCAAHPASQQTCQAGARIWDQSNAQSSHWAGNHRPPILRLPTEIHRLIADFLSAYDCRQLHHSCREFFYVSSESQGNRLSWERLERLWTNPFPPRGIIWGHELDAPLQEAIQLSFQRDLSPEEQQEEPLMEDWPRYSEDLRQQLLARCWPAITVWRETTLPVAMFILNRLRTATPEDLHRIHWQTQGRRGGERIYDTPVYPDHRYSVICRRIIQRVIEIFHPEVLDDEQILPTVPAPHAADHANPPSSEGFVDRQPAPRPIWQRALIAPARGIRWFFSSLLR